jgi:hypothetical protein
MQMKEIFFLANRNAEQRRACARKVADVMGRFLIRATREIFLSMDLAIIQARVGAQ